MSLKLKVDGLKERDVMHVTYGLHRQTDPEGQPAGDIRGGKITLHLKSTNDGNIEFFEWASDPRAIKNGSLDFFKMDKTNMKTLSFEHAFLVNYEEIYDVNDGNSQIEVVTISAKKISINNAIHDNTWTMQ